MEKSLSREYNRRDFIKGMLASGIALSYGYRKAIERLTISAANKLVDLNKTPYKRITTSPPCPTLDLDEKSCPKIGLALGGGGLKGYVHLGVIPVLIEAGISKHIKLVSGTSIGALVGAIFCSRKDWTVDEWEKVIERIYSLDFFDLASGMDFKESSLQRNDNLKRLIEEFVPNDFNKLAIPLRVVVTSFNNEEKQVFVSGDLRKVLLASCSLQGIYPHVTINGEEYIDGGYEELLPSKVLTADSKPIYRGTRGLSRDKVIAEENSHAEYIIGSDVGASPSKGFKRRGPIKDLIYSFLIVQDAAKGNSLDLCDFVFYGNPVGSPLSVEDCKKDITYGYMTAKKSAHKLISSIKSKAEELGLIKSA